MKQQKNATMGLEINLSVPETNEEFDKLSGRANAACEDAVKYNVLHGYNTTFRGDFVEAVEKETGIKRTIDQEKTDKQAPKKDGTKTPVYEKDLLYFKRVLAETSRPAVSFQTLAQSVADKIPLDLSEGTRQGRIGKEYTLAAEDLLSKETSAPGTLARVVANLERLNPGLTVEIDSETSLPTVDGLAKAIKANADRTRQEDMAELAA